LAGERHPELILLDLALPGRSGLEVLNTLKESQPTREIPVIIVSAYALLLAGTAVGRADGLVQKPFDLTDLLLRVKQARAHLGRLPEGHRLSVSASSSAS
jgi:CheY-like chemotaxis protein